MNASRCWPDELQMLVLRAALTDGPDAIRAFEWWCDRTDFDGPIELHTMRTLPLVHANLVRLGCDHPRMGLLRGLRRRAWVETQFRLSDASRALAILAGAGITAMVAKGIPLALCYYEKPALRAMADIDLLVDPSQAKAAMNILIANGWRETLPGTLLRSDYLVAARHAIPFRGESGVELDLHWHLLHEATTAAARRRFWAGAVPIDVGGVEALRPGATDLLIHVMIHGMRQDLTPPMRWIADSMMILRKDGPSIDWESLVDFGRQARLLTRLGAAVEFLRTNFGADIPDRVIEIVRRARPTMVEHLEHGMVVGLGDGVPRAGARSTYLIAKAIRMAQSDQRVHLPGVAWRWLVRRATRPNASV